MTKEDDSPSISSLLDFISNIESSTKLHAQIVFERVKAECLKKGIDISTEGKPKFRFTPITTHDFEGFMYVFANDGSRGGVFICRYTIPSPYTDSNGIIRIKEAEFVMDCEIPEQLLK